MQDLGQLLSQGGSLVPQSASPLPQTPGAALVPQQPTTGQSWAGPTGSGGGPMPQQQGASADPLQGLDINDPEQVEANKTGWKKFFSDLRQNPQMMAYMINFGAGLAATGQVHEAVQYGLAGVGRYQQELSKIQQQQIENQRADRQEDRADRQIDIDEQRAGYEGERVNISREQLEADKDALAARLDISRQELDLRAREVGLKEEEIALANNPNSPQYRLLEAKIKSEQTGQTADLALADERRAGAKESGERARLARAQTEALGVEGKVNPNLWNISGDMVKERQKIGPDGKPVVDDYGEPVFEKDPIEQLQNYNLQAQQSKNIKPIYKPITQGIVADFAEKLSSGVATEEDLRETELIYGPQITARVKAAVNQKQTAPPSGERDVD